MPTARLNGIDVYYEEHGSGYPVIFSHGYAASSRMWAPQREAFSKQYRFITWDVRGHGLTDSPEEQAQYTEAQAVEDERHLLQSLAIQQAVVGGLSLGGYLSLAFYLAHPEMVRALILCDTGPGYRNPAAREQWNQTAETRARAFEERGFEALGSSAEVQASAAGHRSAAGLARAARGILAQFDSRVIESLPEVKVPTLVIVGERDTPFLNASDYMTSKIPGARKVLIPDAGHSANIDQPEAFNRAVLDFLAETVS
ncbi:MAG: alpha/beta fold hydrolase [Dehalococcoidia bacterium]